MKNSKKLFITTLGLIAAVIVIIFSLKIYISIQYPEKILKNVVTTFFKENFNKAVKFDEVFFNTTGNIVLTNFDLSITSDFNDNMSLIKSRETIFRVSLAELLRGNITINSIDYSDSTVSVLKKYGKDYIESFRGITGLKQKIFKIKNLNHDRFKINFYNTTFLYKEIFKDNRLTIKCSNINTGITFEDDTIKYKFNGILRPYKTKSIQNGNIILEGEIFSNYKSPTIHKIKIENLDLTYFNDFIREYKQGSISIMGGLYTDIKILSDNNKIAYSGKIETNNFSMISHGSTSYNIISNENLNSEIDIQISNEKNKIEVKKIVIFDEIFKISGSGIYRNDKDSNNLKINFNSNKIDLEKLSAFITPAKDICYKGFLETNGNIDYDFNDNKAENIFLNLGITDFILNRYNEGTKTEIVRKGALDFKIRDNSIKVSLKSETPKSDFNLNSTSKITSWLPLKSNTDLSVVSKDVSLNLLCKTLTGGLDRLLALSFKDHKKGYAEIYFLDKPVGRFTRNNNMHLTYRADNITCGQNAKFNDLLVDINHTNGKLNLDKFSLKGYGAKYSMAIKALFNRDYPSISINARVGGLDLGLLSKDYSDNSFFSGKLYLDYQNELNAYRISHLVENTRGKLNIRINRGNFSNTEVQKNINSFLTKNGFSNINTDIINFSHLSGSFMQYGSNFYFRNLSIMSDILNFSSYGKYDYHKGIDMNIYARFTDMNKKKVRIPLKLEGKLFSPMLSMKKKKSISVSLFNIN